MKTTTRRALACGVAVAAVVTACGRSSPSSTSTTNPGTAAAGSKSAVGVSTNGNTVLTKAPSTDAESAVWAVYRETSTIDPLFAFDYPDNTAMALACESLLRQNPDQTIGPGLAKSVEYKTETSLVATLRDDVKFWDGTPLTAADAVYSLKRQQDAANAGFYSAIFANVTAIAATGTNEVTLTTTGRDMLLLSELAGPAGVVTEEKYTTAKGKDYGTAAGGAMCTGPFKFKSWVVGEGVTFERFEDYWDKSLPRKLKTITIKGVSDEAVLTSGLITGEISGTYSLGVSTLEQLRSNDKVTVSEGSSYAISAFIASDFGGALGDVKVRQALSLAIDRPGLVKAIYKGAGFPARALGVPGMWGYAKDTFIAGWNALPDLSSPNVEAAKKLVAEAGAAGKTVRIGMTNEIATVQTAASEFQRALESIGMKAELVSVSAANYINFFIDAAARKDVDGFFTTNYSNTADPLSLFVSLIGPNGSQAYNGFADPAAIDLLAKARAAGDDTKRAEYVVQLQKIITDNVLWVPMVAPTTALVMNKGLTGAPATFQFMFGPWAAYLGKP